MPNLINNSFLNGRKPQQALSGKTAIFRHSDSKFPFPEDLWFRASGSGTPKTFIDLEPVSILRSSNIVSLSLRLPGLFFCFPSPDSPLSSSQKQKNTLLILHSSFFVLHLKSLSLHTFIKQSYEHNTPRHKPCVFPRKNFHQRSFRGKSTGIYVWTEILQQPISCNNPLST